LRVREQGGQGAQAEQIAHDVIEEIVSGLAQARVVGSEAGQGLELRIAAERLEQGGDKRSRGLHRLLAGVFDVEVAGREQAPLQKFEQLIGAAGRGAQEGELAQV
jgi:hypothetical protein